MIKRSRRHKRRQPMAEINVVPYIDVMLVLLVIFMVTAPLITSGIKVNLPQAKTGAIPSPSVESVVITVDQFGDYYIDAGDDKHLPATLRTIRDRVRVVLDYKRDTPILVRADNQVPYEKVIYAMAAAQAGGAPDVGLVTAPPPRREP
ncbi:MAG: protein TolR [Bdellovibrio bacteriovorus]